MNTQDKAREVISEVESSDDGWLGYVCAYRILSALTSAGLAVVPVEPTDEMIEAAARTPKPGRTLGQILASEYRAMLKASGAIK